MKAVASAIAIVFAYSLVAASPVRAQTVQVDGENVTVDVPGVSIRVQGDQAAVKAPGTNISANGANGYRAQSSTTVSTDGSTIQSTNVATGGASVRSSTTVNANGQTRIQTSSSQTTGNLNPALKTITLTNGEVSHNCANGGQVQITGSNNDIELLGNCQSVTLNGANNTVAIEAVAKISVMGANNDISYRRAIGARKPAVSVMGANTSVFQAE